MIKDMLHKRKEQYPQGILDVFILETDIWK